MRYLVYEREGSEAPQWSEDLNRLADQGWRVHTIAFPRARMVVALLARGSVGSVADEHVEGASRLTDADPMGGVIGSCVVCGIEAPLDAQRTCGEHKVQIPQGSLLPSKTTPRKRAG